MRAELVESEDTPRTHAHTHSLSLSLSLSRSLSPSLSLSLSLSLSRSPSLSLSRSRSRSRSPFLLPDLTPRRYTLIAVDAERTAANKVDPGEPILALMRAQHQLELFIVHNDESHYALKLIKLEDQKVCVCVGGCVWVWVWVCLGPLVK
jgi:hypothetical protein